MAMLLSVPRKRRPPVILSIKYIVLTKLNHSNDDKILEMYQFRRKKEKLWDSKQVY